MTFPQPPCPCSVKLCCWSLLVMSLSWRLIRERFYAGSIYDFHTILDQKRSLWDLDGNYFLRQSSHPYIVLIQEVGYLTPKVMIIPWETWMRMAICLQIFEISLDRWLQQFRMDYFSLYDLYNGIIKFDRALGSEGEHQDDVGLAGRLHKGVVTVSILPSWCYKAGLAQTVVKWG